MYELLSKSYKGFVIQQVPNNNWWQISVVPNRFRFGFISPGPYASFNICKNIIDKILGDDLNSGELND